MMHEIRPLLTDTIEHWLPPVRDIHGREISAGTTPHAARVTLSPGSAVSSVSSVRMPDAAAVVWLIDHPRPIRIGDTFTLPDAQSLKVIRAELRSSAAGTIHKVYLT